MNRKPELIHSELIAKTRIFRVERLNLRFANGSEVEYERLCGQGRGAVMIIPLLDAKTILLVREYAAGVDRYDLSFPKGLIEKGETPEAAANREIKEEIGYGAYHLDVLKKLTVAPGYADFETHIVLARDLYPQSLIGDEPEPIETVAWSLDDLDALLQRSDFVEARSIAALYLLRRKLQTL